MGKAASKKSAYLVTDPGFAARFVAALAFEAVVCVLVTHVPSLQWAVSDAVSAVEENLMKGAHALKWWSLIALLASSCCALQILLSAAALGCSGLNSVLGPLRPLSLAVTAALQAAAWHTVAPGQAPSVAAFSAFTAALTFLPEALDAFERRGRARSLERIKRGGKSSRVVELAIALSNVGCAACAVSVRKALEKSPLVASVVSVDVDTAMAVVELTTNVDCGGEGGDSQDAQLSLRSATEQLTAVLRAAGYAPADAAVPNGTDTDADTDAGTRDSKKTVTTSAQPSSSSGAVLGAVLGGLACSSCCAIQLGLNAAASAGLGLSVGCAGFNKTLGPLRSVMRGLTALYYAYMWVRALFFAKVNGGGGGSCGDTVMKSGDGDGRCPPSQTAKAKSATLRSLALSTTMCVALTFLPELLLATGGPALAAPTTGAQRISLSISGMGCEACQVHVRETLLTASGAGVLDASADFTTGKAEVWVNPDWGGDGVGFDLDKVRANLAEMGYELEETQKGKAQGKTALTGAGAATGTVPNQTTSKEEL